MNLPFYVLKKGEENAGNIFIKILITETTSKVLSQVNDFNGGTRWEPISLENYIISNSKELKNINKSSKSFQNKYQNEKSKLNIQRFKGLGEMNPEELWNTTLNPETRNLLVVQYSKNVKKDHDLIHTLMGSDVSSRKDFIIENAINVSNLDV